MAKSLKNISYLLIFVVGMCLFSAVANAEDRSPVEALKNFVRLGQTGKSGWDYLSENCKWRIVDLAIQMAAQEDPEITKGVTPETLKKAVYSELSNPSSEMSVNFWQGFWESFNQAKIDPSAFDQASVRIEGNTAYISNNGETIVMFKENGAWKWNLEF
ncbi:hypothetical protein IJT10_03540 [bacterium]|nr:hypothetical protein [bacterium]